MRGGRALLGLQKQAVISEYKKAKEIGAEAYASRIYAANPDLHREFGDVDRQLEKASAGYRESC